MIRMLPWWRNEMYAIRVFRGNEQDDQKKKNCRRGESGVFIAAENRFF